MARRAKKTPGINGSSSADIAFMLLIFFLITTSMDTDKGLLRRLPPLAPKQQEEKQIEINERNIMRLLVNRQDQIVILKDKDIIKISIDQLKDKAVEFIYNKKGVPTLSDMEVKDIPLLGGKVKVVISGYAISLKSEIESSYQTFINVQNELLRAYNEVWEQVAKDYLGKEFKDLTPEQQGAIKEAFPMHISEMPLSNLEKK